jgi:Predicted Zn peptidase
MSSNSVIQKEIVTIIQDVVKEIKSTFECEDVIKDGIFDLLEKECTVIYFPIKDEKNRGFHIKRAVKDKLEDFVFINTDKTVEQQVFTASHELGHIFDVYGKVAAKAREKEILLDESDKDFEEDVTDRFAAEFIMPEKEFIRSTYRCSKELGLGTSVSVYDILTLIARLMEEYMSPFNAVRKRLHEINAIDDKSNQYLSITAPEKMLSVWAISRARIVTHSLYGA